MDDAQVNISVTRRELRQLIVAAHQGEEYLRNRKSESCLYVYEDLADIYANLAAKLDRALYQD